MKKLLLVTALFASTQLSAQVLAPPIDFESTTIAYTFTNFDGGNAAVIANPDPSGINTSANVGRMIKNVGQPWGGSYIEMTNPIDFSVNKIFKMKVWSPAVDRRVLLKVEDPTNGAIFFEVEDTSTVANAWEELTFDFTPINTSNTYQRIVLIWDLGVVGDGSPNFTYYFDDINLVAGAAPLQQIDLPITFEDTLVDYTTTDFGGNASILVSDPINPSNTVSEVTKTASAQLWAGTTISTPNGLANVIPFTASETTVSARVWSPDAGIPVRLKAEDHTNNMITVETETLTTTSGEWETMVFDFSNEVMGTSVLNLNDNYDMLSIFFNFGTDGATAGQKIYYYDDVQFGSPCSVSSTEDVAVCNVTTYDWNGNTYNSSGTYTYSTQNAGECDSTATLNLTMGTETTSSIIETALDVYTAPSGATYTASGIYMDTISNAAGCDSIITIDLTMSFTSLNEFDLQDIMITPNPANHQITITVNENSLAKPIFIMDQTGRIVIESEVSALQNTIDVKALKNGLYYLKLGNLKAIKFVKE